MRCFKKVVVKVLLPVLVISMLYGTGMLGQEAKVSYALGRITTHGSWVASDVSSSVWNGTGNLTFRLTYNEIYSEYSGETMTMANLTTETSPEKIASTIFDEIMILPDGLDVYHTPEAELTAALKTFTLENGDYTYSDQSGTFPTYAEAQTMDNNGSIQVSATITFKESALSGLSDGKYDVLDSDGLTMFSFTVDRAAAPAQTTSTSESKPAEVTLSTTNYTPGSLGTWQEVINTVKAMDVEKLSDNENHELALEALKVNAQRANDVVDKDAIATLAAYKAPLALHVFLGNGDAVSLYNTDDLSGFKGTNMTHSSVFTTAGDQKILTVTYVQPGAIGCLAETHYHLQGAQAGEMAAVYTVDAAGNETFLQNCKVAENLNISFKTDSKQKIVVKY